MPKLTLKSKLILVFLLIGLLPFLIVAISTSTTASNALQKRSFEQLTAQSATAAEEISSKIDEIQMQTKESVKSIQNIAQVISEIGSSSKNITQIASASSQSTTGSTQVNGQAGELSKIAEHLNGMMQKFKISA